MSFVYVLSCVVSRSGLDILLSTDSGRFALVHRPSDLIHTLCFPYRLLTRSHLGCKFRGVQVLHWCRVKSDKEWKKGKKRPFGLCRCGVMVKSLPSTSAAWVPFLMGSWILVSVPELRACPFYCVLSCLWRGPDILLCTNSGRPALVRLSKSATPTGIWITVIWVVGPRGANPTGLGRLNTRQRKKERRKEKERFTGRLF